MISYPVPRLNEYSSRARGRLVPPYFSIQGGARPDLDPPTRYSGFVSSISASDFWQIASHSPKPGP